MFFEEINWDTVDVFINQYLENGSSLHMFYPSEKKLSTLNYLQKFTKNTDIEFYEDFPKPFSSSTKSFMMLEENATLPVGYLRPSKDFNITRNNSTVTFDIDIPENTASLLIQIICDNCIKKTQDITNFHSVTNPLFILKGYGRHAHYEMEINGSGFISNIGFSSVHLSNNHLKFR